MNKTQILIGFRSIYPLSTRGPGDMIPYSSTMASTYETPILPRLETMLGAIAKTIIENKHIDTSPCNGIGDPDKKWECIVSLVFREYLGVQSVLGPVLVVSRQHESGDGNRVTKYYVNAGSRLLKLSGECVCDYIEAAKALWHSIKEADVKRKYNKMNNYREILEELSSKECIVSPHTIFATGVSLDNVSRTARHGLIYSYVLRDFATLTSGRKYMVGLIAEVDEGRKQISINENEITALIGPRGRPGLLVEEYIDDIGSIIELDFDQGRISISPTPLRLLDEEDVIVVHPLKPRPLVVQLAKSTLLNGKWAKTSVEPAYRAGIVMVRGGINCHRIGYRAGKFRVYYSIQPVEC